MTGKRGQRCRRMIARRRPQPPPTGKADEVKVQILALAQDCHTEKMRILQKKDQLQDAKLRAGNNEAEFWAAKTRQVIDAQHQLPPTSHAIQGPLTSNSSEHQVPSTSRAVWQPFTT